MNLAFARVTETACLYGSTHITWFEAPEITQGATPGQFVMLRCVPPSSGTEPTPSLPVDPLLPRPMSIHRVREGPNGLEWAILYDIVGRGTAWLADRALGDLAFCWGPLGRGYAVDANTKQLLLIAGGIGVAPLVWLADESVRQRRSVTLILGGRAEEQIFPASQLPQEVEVVIMTEDGSVGERGLATDAFAKHLEWCDQAFACGPNAMFAALANVARRSAVRRPIQALLEERMGCGTGICYGCALETKRKGIKLVCRDGPMFELRDLY